jgi:hypothetical protein
MEDVISLDPVKLKAMSLQQLVQLMRTCGLSTVGIGNEGEALQRLINRAAIKK